MKRSYEEHYHAVEAQHWWFRARRQMVGAVVQRVAPARTQAVLDIGCSSGHLLRVLQSAGYVDVQGIDASEPAIALCKEQGLRAQVMDAHAPVFAEASFDVICASDVLEHLEQDGRALEAWHRLLKPGGWLIVFVPAYAWLWTQHDEVNLHFRRYTRPGLVQLLRTSGFEVRRSSYWNTALFFPVAALRLWRRRQRPATRPSGPQASDMFLPPAPINAALRLWLGLENRVHLLGWNSPLGISVMALARKPAAFALPGGPG